MIFNENRRYVIVINYRPPLKNVLDSQQRLKSDLRRQKSEMTFEYVGPLWKKSSALKQIIAKNDTHFVIACSNSGIKSNLN